MRRAAWLVAPACVAAAALLSGCSQSSAGPVGVAQRFVQAVSQQDGKSACDLLTPKAESSAGGAGGTACKDAVVHIDEKGSDVRHAEVWGDAAIVSVGSDTVFLRHLQNGWHVSAAGCTLAPGGVFDCDVQA